MSEMRRQRRRKAIKRWKQNEDEADAFVPLLQEREREKEETLGKM